MKPMQPSELKLGKDTLLRIGYHVFHESQSSEYGLCARVIRHRLEDDHPIILESDAIVEIKHQISAFELSRVVDEEKRDPFLIGADFPFEAERARVGELRTRVQAFVKR